MSRRGRIAAGVLSVPLAVVALLAALVAWVFATEAGTRWALEQARPYLPEGVAFERAEGVLAGPLTLHGLALETAAARVEVERLHLDWAPSALVWSEIRVGELALTGVDVALRETGPATADAGPVLPRRIALPAAVVLERLLVEDVALRLADGRVQRVERIALRASAGEDGITVEGLEVSAPLADLGGELQLSSTRPYGLDGTIRWQLHLPAPAPGTTAGRLELGGSLRRLRARVAVEQPAAADLHLEARLFDQPPVWSGSLQVPVTELRRWWSEAPALSAGADLQLEGSFEQAAVTGTLGLEGLPTGPLRASVDARGTAGAVMVERLRVEPRRRPGAALTARGEIDLAGPQPRFDARLDWQDLAWPLVGTAAVSSEFGTLAIAGTAEAYTLEGEARLRTPRTGAEAVRIAGRAEGSTRALSQLALQADWQGARLDADGRVQWSPDGTAELQLALDGLDPGRLAPPLAGRVNARAGLVLHWGEALRASLDLGQLDGELNGRPLSGSARVHYVAGRARIESLAFRLGEARVTASGSVDAELALDWQVDIPRLEALVPGYQGRIAGSGRASGPPTAPRVDFELKAGELHTPSVAVARLTASGSVAPLGDARSELALDAGGIVTDALTIESLALRGSGTRADHRLEATLQSDRGGLELALTGVFADGDWQARVRQATLTPDRLARWTLVAPADLAWREGRLDLQRTCWRSDGARVCAAASGSRDDWQAQVDGRSIPLGLVASLARDDLDYTGSFDLQARFVAAAGPVTGEARVALTPGTVSGVLDDEPTILLKHGAGRLEARLQPGAIEWELELPLSADGRLRLDGRLGRGRPHTLDARLQARIEDLSLLNALSPRIGRPEGRLLADLELGGTLERPSASGSARLEAGRLEVLPLGIELTQLRADLATDDQALELTLGARSGDGELEADLRLARGADGGWRGSGTLSGEDFRAVNLPTVTAVVSPALDWRVDGRGIDVGGELRVASARITPRDLSGAVRASSDAVIVSSATPAETEPPFRVTADVTLVLGPEVRIDAFGLVGRLEGSIRVRERPEQLTSATGELRVVGGSYSIYGQTLQIERGRVIFDGGPVANPGLDVRAVRRPRDVVVGVNVRGTLREPRVDLFSEPPMEQSQQLAYLVIGVPLRETSTGEQSSLAAAAAALASTEQGAQLASQIGIEEVSVEQGEPGAAGEPGEGVSLVLGRYLSPRLYVGYGIGLAEQANSARMRYTLTDHWSLEARSGLTSSADLLYSIEVDSTVDALPKLPGTGTDEPQDAAAQ